MKKTVEKQYATTELQAELKYLKLLAETFPNLQDASTEVINLEAIMNLPK